jgi:hypothetical protein
MDADFEQSDHVNRTRAPSTTDRARGAPRRP